MTPPHLTQEDVIESFDNYFLDVQQLLIMAGLIFIDFFSYVYNSL